MAQRSAPVVPTLTLDTSVYVGALNSRGFGYRLFYLAQSKLIRIDISDAILDETCRVLRERFEWDAYRLRHARIKLASVTNRVAPTEFLQVIKEDPPDNRILECAAEAGSEFILTWDKDLLRLGEYAGIKIMTPSQFLERGRER